MAYNRCVGTRYCAKQLSVQGSAFQFFRLQPAAGRKKKIAGALNVYKEYFAPFTEKRRA